MKLGLWLDIVAFAALFLIPLPDAWHLGTVWVVGWIAVTLFTFAVLTRLSCSPCPFLFCPIGKFGKAVWGDRSSES